MYNEFDHIEIASTGKLFGHYQSYKYRVLDKNCEFPIHHTNSMEDAKWYFNKCKKQWLLNDHHNSGRNKPETDPQSNTRG